MNKVVLSIEQAIADIEDGAVIAIPGFFAAGVPRILLRALIAKGVKDLILACGCGPLLGASEELESLVRNRQLKKVIEVLLKTAKPSTYMNNPVVITMKALQLAGLLLEPKN